MFRFRRHLSSITLQESAVPKIFKRFVGNGRVWRAQINAFFMDQDTTLFLFPAGGQHYQGRAQKATKSQCDFRITHEYPPIRL